jgi:hypothetical protein
LNYLRSMFDGNFFQQNPQEFIASIANEWFTDSDKTFQLGLTRFASGRPEPLNQALYFAELYSVGGNTTKFYRTDTAGHIQSTDQVLRRNSLGQIDQLSVGGQQYQFLRDSSGNVLDVQIVEPPKRFNLALASNGAVALASTTYASNFSPDGAIDGDRKGLSWASGGGWNDASLNTYPDWLEVDFAGPKVVQEIDVVTVQDNFSSPIEPDLTTTFSLYGITDFQAQFWTGTDWVNVPGGVVTANNRVWRQVNFNPVTTTRIRVLVTGALNGYSRITEFEAYGPVNVNNNAPTITLTAPANNAAFNTPAFVPLSANANDTDGTITNVDFFSGTTLIATSTNTANPFTATWNNPPSGNHVITAVATDNFGATATSLPANIAIVDGSLINFALASNGATAVASTTSSNSYPAQSAINGDHKGLGWASGTGGWNDSTHDSYPDWLEVNFNAYRNIQEIDLFTLQDNYVSPVEPTAGMTFSSYGVTDFQVEYWNGSDWLLVPGGLVTGNRLVWRKFTFSPIFTPRIRILVTGALNGYSRITEIEAYGSSGFSNNSPTVTLTSPAHHSVFNAPATIALNATANDTDGQVVRVDYYGGTILVATSTNPTNSFAAKWNDVPPGNYPIHAIATDNLGAQTVSNTNTVRVATAFTSIPPTQLSGLISDDGGITVQVSGPAIFL